MYINGWEDIKELFNLVRKKKPAVIFLDEIDSILNIRNDNVTHRLKIDYLLQIQKIGIMIKIYFYYEQ